MVYKLAILLTAASLLGWGCSSSSDRHGENNFTAEGFINSGCFQAIVKSEPADISIGLVNQRESAFFVARKKIAETAMESLVLYCVNSSLKRQGIQNDKIKNMGAAESYARTELSRYRDAGSIAAEYYLEDNSVVLVYRIREAGMKNRLDSIFIKFEQ